MDRTAYFSVTDVDAIVGKLNNLGGLVLQGPHDVFTAGRMTLIRDSEGATFSVWQPCDEIGCQIIGEPGTLNWCELNTNDPDAQAAFYSGVFGWTRFDTTGAGGHPYMLFQSDGENAAGMMTILEEWGAVSPNWSVYFGVQDCGAALEKATSLGGSVALPAQDVPDVGRFALLSDLEGAYFYVLQFSGTSS